MTMNTAMSTRPLPGFDALCAFLKSASGIVIDEDKIYLVDSRVMPIVARERMSGLAELIGVLERGTAPALAGEVIEAMTVNETYFFRDKQPFEAFRDIMLPKLIELRAREKTIRIWSAACSAGQEPYSLAMLVEEAGHRLKDWRVDILATDISEGMLEKARCGTYSTFDVQRGLPERYLRANFNSVNSKWQLSDDIRKRIRFQKLNLLDDFSALGTFDIVFCRNVLIYFELSRKKEVMRRLASVLAPDGFLVLGTCETVSGLEAGLVPNATHHFFSLDTSWARRRMPAQG